MILTGGCVPCQSGPQELGEGSTCPCQGWMWLCLAAPSRFAYFGLAACPSDVWFWLAALVCSSSLRTGRKWEENIQCTDAGQKPDVMELLIPCTHPLLAKQVQGDKAWWIGEQGAEENPNSSGVGRGLRLRGSRG